MIPIRVVRDEYERIADKVMEVMTAKTIGQVLKPGFYWVWPYNSDVEWTIQYWDGEVWHVWGGIGVKRYTPYRIAHLIEPPLDPRNWNDV